MGREYAEKIFTENLDRLLDGKEIKTDAVLGSDLLTALEFALKMKSLRADPSLRFESHLKSILIERLHEKTIEDRQGWFRRLLPREPVWQVLVVLTLMVVVGGVLWGTLFQGSPSPMAPATSTAPSFTSAPATTAASATTAAPGLSANLYLKAEAGTDKAVYSSREPVKIHISWQNTTAQDLTIEEFPPILSLMQSSSKQPVYTFTAGKDSLTLAPGEIVEYTETWDQLDAQGRQVPYGDYYLELEEMYYQGHAVQNEFVRPVHFDIQDVH